MCVCVREREREREKRKKKKLGMLIAFPLPSKYNSINLGRLLPEKALARGLQEGPIFKELKSGRSVQAPDGSMVNPEDVIGPKRRGRKIVILGDTCNSSQIVPLARSGNSVSLLLIDLHTFFLKK